MRWNEHSGVPVRPESATKDPKRNSIAGLNSPEIPEGFPLRKSRPIKGLTFPALRNAPANALTSSTQGKANPSLCAFPPVTRKATSASNRLLSFRWDAPPGRVEPATKSHPSARERIQRAREIVHSAERAYQTTSIYEAFARQQCLYFFPLPQGHGSFRPALTALFTGAGP